MLLQTDGIVEDFIADLTVIQLFYYRPNFAIISYHDLFSDSTTDVIFLLPILLVEFFVCLSLSLTYSSSLRHQNIVELIRPLGTP